MTFDYSVIEEHLSSFVLNILLIKTTVFIFFPAESKWMQTFAVKSFPSSATK